MAASENLPRMKLLSDQLVPDEMRRTHKVRLFLVHTMNIVIL